MGTYNTTPPALSNGVQMDNQIDAAGNLKITPDYATPWVYAGVTGGIVATTPNALKAAAGAGLRNYLTGIQFKNTSAVASEIEVRDGATVIWRGHASASMTVSDGWTFVPPLRSTANTALNVAMVTTATATIVSAQGYVGV